jgi:hypothetical protein
MELTGGAASRAMGGDEKSGCMGEEMGSGCNVRVERLVRALRLDMAVFRTIFVACNDRANRWNQKEHRWLVDW